MQFYSYVNNNAGISLFFSSQNPVCQSQRKTGHEQLVIIFPLCSFLDNSVIVCKKVKKAKGTLILLICTDLDGGLGGGWV